MRCQILFNYLHGFIYFVMPELPASSENVAVEGVGPA